jgi:6-phosphogluconolactonase
MRLLHGLSLIMLAMITWSTYPVTATIESGKAIVYVGTFKRESSKGIYAWRLDMNSGKMEPLGLAADTMRPVFIALHPNRRFLYAVSRPTAVDRTNIGVVLAYSIDNKTGQLTSLNSVSTRGIDPAYVVVDRTGKNVLVANFGSNDGNGCVAVFPIRKDGSLAEASEFVQYSGTGVHPQRQKGPHSHTINVSPDNRFAFVADLGLDKIFIYHFDAEKGKLTPNSPAYVTLPPGSGPRQFVFHPGGKFFFVVNEIQSTVTTFAYSSGSLKEVQTVSMLPQGFSGTNSAGTVQVHPNGKFLYASNRGADDIVVYAIDPHSGMLTLVEAVQSQGKTPGNFAIDPSGSWLLVANQSSDSLVMFRIDPQTGRLTSTGQRFEIGTPTSVRFLPLK